MQPPKIRRGGPGGKYAYCWHPGESREVSLGRYGSEEAFAKYAAILSRIEVQPKTQANLVTFGEIVKQYWSHAKVYYRDHDGRPTGTADVTRSILLRVASAWQERLADSIGPRDLHELRLAMIEEGLARSTINLYVQRIKQIFKWALSLELIEGTSYVKLVSLAPLEPGRSMAREKPARAPVPEDHLLKTLAHCPDEIRDIVVVQLHTGCRPSETLEMRLCDIEDWIYRPARHKNRWRGKPRGIAIGPIAREVIERRSAGIAPESPILTFRGKPINHRQYEYRVEKAAKQAGVPVWTPHQLKHSHHTTVRKKYGLEAAREVAGHSSVATTEIYAERAIEVARRIAEEIG